MIRQPVISARSFQKCNFLESALKIRRSFSTEKFQNIWLGNKVVEYPPRIQAQRTSKFIIQDTQKQNFTIIRNAFWRPKESHEAISMKTNIMIRIHVTIKLI